MRILRYKRDTYRYTGRTKSGFEMHMQAVYCKLKEKKGGYCWRHQPKWNVPNVVTDVVRRDDPARSLPPQGAQTLAHATRARPAKGAGAEGAAGHNGAKGKTMKSQKEQPAHQVSDLEITKLCAEAMGMTGFYPNGVALFRGNYVAGTLESYDPLHQDEHAMALVKRFKLTIIRNADDCFALWTVGPNGIEISPHDSDNDELNTAIVECVAKMQREVSVRGSDNATPK